MISFFCLKPGVITWLSMSSMTPSTPTTGVGNTAPFGFSLYRLTLPPVTGVFRTLQASPIPPTASRKVQYTSGLYGFPKLRQFVIATGLAPLHTTFLAASATAICPPRRGFRYTYRPLQSVLTARPLFVPLILITPESDAPGAFTVFVRTMVSYCSCTHRLDAIFGDASSLSSVLL